MKMTNEDEKELSLEKARELLGNPDISDEKLQNIIRSVKIFCKVSYQLYAAKQKKEEQEGFDRTRPNETKIQ